MSRVEGTGVRAIEGFPIGSAAFMVSPLLFSFQDWCWKIRKVMISNW